MTNLDDLRRQAETAASEIESVVVGRGRVSARLKAADDLAAFALKFDPDDGFDIEALRNLARAYQISGTQRETAQNRQ